MAEIQSLKTMFSNSTVNITDLAMLILKISIDVRDGDGWKHAALLADSAADDATLAGVLKRAMRANELMVGAIGELRSAIIAADAANLNKGIV